MLIAVTSKTGTEIDQHFGHAEKFRIYKYRKGDPVQVSEVEVEKYCSFDPDHPFRHRQFDGIAEALKDCKAVLTAMIAREGAAAVAAYGAGSKVEVLLLLAPMALSSAINPFVGQNHGAARERIEPRVPADTSPSVDRSS